RRGHVRALDRLSAVPREQSEPAAASDRLRDAAAAPYAPTRDLRGDRGRGLDGAPKGAREPVPDRARVRGGVDARFPYAACAVGPHRQAGAVRAAAQAAFLPRVLALRDLGGAAREDRKS